MSFVKDYEKLKKEIDYKICENCRYQIEPLRMCEWAELKANAHSYLYLTCPFWEKKEKK